MDISCQEVDNVRFGSPIMSLFPSQALMRKSIKVATVPVLLKEYDIAVEVYPTSFPRGSWTSIFHMTISGNIDKYGSHIPGIWFGPLSRPATKNRILVCNAINGNKNYCAWTPYLPLNRWAKVGVRQQLEGSSYVYRVFVNGEEVFKKVNTQPREFHNVKVYASDPWYVAQRGYIKDVQISQKSSYALSSAVYIFESQTSLTKSIQVSTLHILKKVYDISVEVYPTSFPRGSWTSIFHMTTSGNIDVYGSRIPGIWFYPLSKASTKNRILVCNAIDGNKNYCVGSAYLPLKQWVKVRVTQQLEGSKYVYRVFINDKQIFTKVNTQPREFRNVNVYAADPWYAAQPGYIRSVDISRIVQ